MESGTHSMQLAQANQQAHRDIAAHSHVRPGDWTELPQSGRGRLPRQEARRTSAEPNLVGSATRTHVEADPIDVIHDFSIEDGDMLDLSEVAEQFGFSALEMAAALTLRQSDRGVRVELDVEGETHSLILIRGVQVAALSKASPWIFDAEGTTAAEIVRDETSLPVDTAVSESPREPVAAAEPRVGAKGAETLLLGSEERVVDPDRVKLTDPDAFVFETKTRDVYRNDVLSFKASPNDAPDFAEIAKAFGLTEDEVSATIDLSKTKPGLKVQLQLDGNGHKVAAMQGRDARESEGCPGVLVV